MTVRCTREGQSTGADAEVRDLSTHGIGVYLQGPVQKGDRLVFELPLLTDGTWIQEAVLGEVVWVVPRGEKGEYYAGIYIDQMQKTHPRLFAHLRHLEDAITLPDEYWEERAE